MEGVDRAARVSISSMKRNGTATVKTHSGAGEVVRKEHVKKSSVKNPLGRGPTRKPDTGSPLASRVAKWGLT